MSRLGVRWGCLVAAVLLAAGCAVRAPEEGFTPEPEAPGSRVIAPGPGTGAAVQRLLADARKAARAGRVDQAEVILERAVRIEPRNAVLWYYMARVQLHQGHTRQAEGLAAKSNSLAAGDRRLQADNWRIIAHARAARGDLAGAQAAETRAAALAP